MEILTTPRLTLRSWHYSDLAALHSYSRNPHVGLPAGWKPHETIAETSSALAQMIAERTVWAVTLTDDRRLIGSAGLHENVNKQSGVSVYLGYSFDEAYWGHGYATEAAASVMQYAFGQQRLRELRACCYADNTRSMRVLEKCGFDIGTYTAQTVARPDGTFIEKYTFKMSADDYSRIKAAGV